MNLENKYLKSEKIEKRKYQIDIADSASKKNTLVVLPTGMGKTIIALFLIADKLSKNEDEKILFLAPTKPLVNQHTDFLKKNLDINEEQITIFTGEIKPQERKESWKKSRIIVSTPQVIQNDLISNRLNLKDVSFIIFDEAHHAVGDYAYVFISDVYQRQRKNRLILGITASPGNDSEKILEVCKNLDIENIEIRSKYDKDVKPYVHDLKISWKKIKLPSEFSVSIQLFRKALSERLEKLKNIGVISTRSVSRINRRMLLDAQKKIQAEIKARAKPSRRLFKAAAVQSEAMKINHALELLQTQGVKALKNYFKRIGKEVGSKNCSKSSKNIMSDKNVLEALAHINSLSIEHPKIDELNKIVKEEIQKDKNIKIIIFTHYRDTSKSVTENLKEIKNANPVRFIGQSSKYGDKGLTQKQQAELVESFRKGKYNILIATSVAEEGLDIPSTDLVVFYEPVPSEIRAIQRRGRTARKMPGRVIILIAKGTPDEGYYWSAKRKEKNMRSELDLLRSELEEKFEDTKSLYDKKVVKESDSQRSLKDFNLDIVVDNREYRSNLVKTLYAKGVSIKPKNLEVGDYVLSSRIGVERKTVEDFLDSLVAGRIFRQSSELRNAYSRPMIIIEGSKLLSKRNISQKAIFGCLSSLTVDFGIPIFTTSNSIESADLLYAIANREQKENDKEIVLRGDKNPMNLRERQQFIIEGLPNVSAVLAKRLLSKFGNIKKIVNASEKELKSVKGIGKNKAKDILETINSNY
ncbi:MAG: DEAD/DEAH box helicase [Candidatus Thermoplasmatota archaeon]